MDQYIEFGLVYGLKFLTSQEHLQLVFRDSDRHTKAFNNNSGWLMSQLLGRCVGLVNGEEWKVVREGVAHPFLRKSAASQIPLIQKHVSRHFDNLLHQGNLANGLLDPAEDLKMLPFWVVAEILYGDLSPDMIQDLERLVPLREELFRHVIRGGMTRFGFSRYIPSRLNRLLRAFMVEWKSFNDKACARARSFDPPAQIVHFHDQVAKGSITSDNLLHTLDESLFANLDVTIGGISWNVVFLAAHKEYQNRLKDELAAHSKDDTEYQMYILKNSTLLAACVSESSRLRPLAAFSVPQSAPTPRVIDGYVIPAGTDFIIDTHKLNIQSKVWGADGTVYRPERFLGGEALERRYSFWRFGFGPRQCLGKHLADAIIRTLIAHLVQNYEMGIPDGLEWESNPNSWISHPEMRIQCIRRGV
ncbi:Uu.00g118330.m01.CDS01 [Anthostomella pinea]|uniref:Uu.00g118330.m01.CDS01 n=1 Tax=Anthostomella pinea TaxID=933095 RepID=A0AAI8YH05_9PEZI|nr:Uu.00g118330.m01.CDS01 [Anthostomella pinea]